jgi:hypothetical protein
MLAHIRLVVNGHRSQIAEHWLIEAVLTWSSRIRHLECVCGRDSSSQPLQVNSEAGRVEGELGQSRRMNRSNRKDTVNPENGRPDLRSQCYTAVCRVVNRNAA